jgi:succinoglycan biosynthesis protein ExoA
MPQSPFVTIILPVRNEEKYIRDTLEAVLNQDYPQEKLEVLLVDGDSSDCTVAIARSMQADFSMLSILHNPEKIVPRGFNLALEKARGEIIIRVDGHTRIARDYVRQCINALNRTDAVTVGGRMDPVGKSPVGRAIALATSSPFGVGGSRFHFSSQEEWVDTVYMGAWRRKAFQTYGAMDEELVRNQDDELNYRIRKQGGKILLSPAIQSSYTVRSSLKALWRQYYQYGFWKVRVLQKHRNQMKLRQFVPGAFVLGLLASFLLTLLHPKGWLALAVGVGAYLLVNTWFSLSVAFENDQPTLALTIFWVHATMHVSYGIGFVIGLFCFVGRWQDKKGKVRAINSDLLL